MPNDTIPAQIDREALTLAAYDSEHVRARLIARALVAAEARGIERAVDWHKKNGRICREIANDDPHFNEDDRRRARQAGMQHDASAAGLEKMLIDERSAAIRKLMESSDEA